jgi:hypothetical protein
MTYKPGPTLPALVVFELGDTLAEVDKITKGNYGGMPTELAVALATLAGTLAAKGVPQVQVRPGDMKIKTRVEAIALLVSRLKAVHADQIARLNVM